MDRKITFGKYKGEKIMKLIMTHIGYIMWCLKNVRGFHLTNEEQIVYDAMAISIKRDGCEMTFPIEEMIQFVSDKEALKQLYSPVQNIGKNFYVVPNLNKDKDRVVDLAFKMCAEKKQIKYCDYNLLGDLFGQVEKLLEAESAYSEPRGLFDDEIEAGW